MSEHNRGAATRGTKVKGQKKKKAAVLHKINN